MEKTATEVPRRKTAQKYKTWLDFLFPFFLGSYYKQIAKLLKDDLTSLRVMDTHKQCQDFRATYV